MIHDQVFRSPAEGEVAGVDAVRHYCHEVGGGVVDYGGVVSRVSREVVEHRHVPAHHDGLVTACDRTCYCHGLADAVDVVRQESRHGVFRVREVSLRFPTVSVVSHSVCGDDRCRSGGVFADGVAVDSHLRGQRSSFHGYRHGVYSETLVAVPVCHGENEGCRLLKPYGLSRLGVSVLHLVGRRPSEQELVVTGAGAVVAGEGRGVLIADGLVRAGVCGGGEVHPYVSVHGVAHAAVFGDDGKGDGMQSGACESVSDGVDCRGSIYVAVVVEVPVIGLGVGCFVGCESRLVSETDLISREVGCRNPVNADGL